MSLRAWMTLNFALAVVFIMIGAKRIQEESIVFIIDAVGAGAFIWRGLNPPENIIYH